MGRWPIDRDVMRMVAAGMLLGLATMLVFPLLALGQAGGGEAVATLPQEPGASAAPPTPHPHT